ncbi:MAG: osmosensitive channel signal transduction histidine kinase [Bacteroidetes bacterium]|nr:osmosensitive channel signal transduction histidine kinase [Bacteroidota bacterium]
MKNQNDEFRPNPDEILKKINKEKAKIQKGKLKVFFGMCAGVGKTFAMLEFAHLLKNEGKNVVIGIVETHGRSETEQLLNGLICYPLKKVEYKGITLQELDLDGIIALKPDFVLVDELAHNNAPGSRHLKRYQDIVELLENGINVLTTVNVQHLESRVNTIQDITGIKINETIPDSIIENADEIELIDISPDDLLKRLSEGKVYIPQNAIIAKNNFFKKGNLHALRELSLRLTAERVDMDVVDYKNSNQITSSWRTKDKLMVAVNADINSEKLIRITRRMAYSLDAKWYAINISSQSNLNESERKSLQNNLELAVELGAKIIHIIDDDVVNGILRAAYDYNITQIILGKTNENPLKLILKGGSLTDKLIAKQSNIDFHIVNLQRKKRDKSLFQLLQEKKFSYKEYLISLCFVLFFSGISFALNSFIGYQSVGLIYLLGVTMTSLFLGRGAILLSAIVSVLVWDYFFIPPLYEFSIHSFHDYITLFTNLTVGIILSFKISTLRKIQKNLQSNQKHISTLYFYLDSMNKANSIKDVAYKSAFVFKKYFEIDCIFYLKDKIQDSLDKRVFGNQLLFDEKEFAIASWTFLNKQKSGRFSKTLPNANLQYYPLTIQGQTIGVAGLKYLKNIKPDHETTILIDSLMNQLANTLLREINIDKDKK